MKRGIVITVAVVWLAFMGIGAISANYAYERTIHSYWSLSEKASSLEAKTAYLDKYVAAIEGAGLSGNNAVIFPTPDNSYDQNLAALKSLQQRMHEIQTMNVRSFEYQQAISQITAQEQGEARQNNIGLEPAVRRGLLDYLDRVNIWLRVFLAIAGCIAGCVCAYRGVAGDSAIRLLVYMMLGLVGFSVFYVASVSALSQY